MIGKTFLSRIALLLVMCLLLLAVLSTATFAWYSMTNRVSGSDITFQASGNAGGGDLAIGWRVNDLKNYEISFTETPDIYPMIPTKQPVIGQTTYQDFLFFNSTTQAKNELGEWISKIMGTASSPLTLTGNVGGIEKDAFHLINKNADLDMKVTVDYSLNGSLEDKLRVAFFIGVAPNDALLQGVFGRNDAIHYGVIEAGAKVTDTPFTQDAYMQNGGLTFTLAKASSLSVRLVAWLDGVNMLDDDGNRDCLFSIQFKGDFISP